MADWEYRVPWVAVVSHSYAAECVNSTQKMLCK